jgi:hypothetical protein
MGIPWEGKAAPCSYSGSIFMRLRRLHDEK